MSLIGRLPLRLLTPHWLATSLTFVRNRKSVCFVAGQALGLHASWPLFCSLCPITCWCGRRQNGVIQESSLRILGDDLVFADERVAHSYMELLKGLHVDISLGK